MRVHYAVLLIAAAFLASANAASVTTPTFDRSLTAAQRDVTAQRFLRIHYTEEEREERGIATAVEKTKALLTPSKISQKTLERWVKNNKSPKSALARLNLNSVDDKLLTNPKFKTWATFMAMANKQNPEAAMISALATRYSDDVLSQMIIAAKSAPGTKDLATQLQAGQMSLWKSSGKSADDVLGLLGLKNTGKKLFDNPEFAAWTKYVDDLSESNPKKASLMMTKTLTTQYTDKGLYQMLKAAKEVGTTKKMATDLQHTQLANWLATKQNPRDVHGWMGVKGSAADSVERLAYRKYLDDYNVKYVLK